MRNRTTGRWVLAGFALALILLEVALIPQHSLTVDGQTKALQVYALSPSAFAAQELPYPGRQIDPSYEFFPLMRNNRVIADGRLLSAFPVALSVLAYPFFWLSGTVGLAFFPLVGLFAIIVLLHRFWRFSFSFLLLATAGTYLLIMALEFSEQMVFLALLLSGLTALFRRRLVLAGALVGLSAWFRHEGLIYALSLALAIWWADGPSLRPLNLMRSRAIRFVAGFLPVLIAFLLFNTYFYHLPLGPRMAANVDHAGISLALRLEWAIGLLFFGKVRGIGFFAFMPWALLTMFVLARSYVRLSNRNRVLLLSTGIFLVLVPTFMPNHGFWHFGPRYLAAAVIPATILMRSMWFRASRYKPHSRLRVALRLTLGVPVLLTMAGLAGNYAMHRQLRELSRLFDRLGADIYIVQNPGLTSLLGDAYTRKIIVCAPTVAGAGELLHRLRRDDALRSRRIALIQRHPDRESERERQHAMEDPVADPAARVAPWPEGEVQSLVISQLTDVTTLHERGLDLWVGHLYSR